MSILTRNSEARCVCKFVGVVLHAGKRRKTDEQGDRPVPEL